MGSLEGLLQVEEEDKEEQEEQEEDEEEGRKEKDHICRSNKKTNTPLRCGEQDSHSGGGGNKLLYLCLHPMSNHSLK